MSAAADDLDTLAALLDDDVNRTPTIGSNYAVTSLVDGHVAVSAVTDAEWRGLFSAYGRADLADDPRFSSAGARMQNLGDLIPVMREMAEVTSVDDFMAGAEAHDVPASKINSIDEIPHDPQAIHNEIFVERRHPAAGMIREPRPAARLSATPAVVSGHAPLFGEHSDEIVAELGLDPVALRAAGVIH